MLLSRMLLHEALLSVLILPLWTAGIIYSLSLLLITFSFIELQNITPTPTSSTVLFLQQGAGLGDPQRSLPTPNIL